MKLNKTAQHLAIRAVQEYICGVIDALIINEDHRTYILEEIHRLFVSVYDESGLNN